MEQLSSSETSKDVWKEKELIDLMEKSLPNYVVNCFLSAGYDNTAAIVNMTTEGPENSLDQIEQFILKYFPLDASCYSPNFIVGGKEPFKTPPFVFLPGHRFLIAKFVNDVKAKHFLNIKLSKKRPAGKVNDSGPTNTGVKKQKTSVCNEQQEPTNNCYNLERISDDVRKKIIEWQKKPSNSPEIKTLQEHSDYKVNCKLNDSGNLVVNVWCRFCNKDHQLSQKVVKNGNVITMLSNWSCHVPRCLEKWSKFQLLEERKQPKITSKFLQVKEKSNNGQQVKLGIPPDEDSDTSKDSNSKRTSDFAADGNPEAGQRLCHSKHSEANSNEALISDASDKETPQVFQHSPPVLVSQEGKLVSHHHI